MWLKAFSVNLMSGFPSTETSLDVVLYTVPLQLFEGKERARLPDPNSRGRVQFLQNCLDTETKLCSVPGTKSGHCLG